MIQNLDKCRHLKNKSMSIENEIYIFFSFLYIYIIYKKSTEFFSIKHFLLNIGVNVDIMHIQIFVKKMSYIKHIHEFSTFYSN